MTKNISSKRLRELAAISELIEMPSGDNKDEPLRKFARLLEAEQPSETRRRALTFVGNYLDTDLEAPDHKYVTHAIVVDLVEEVLEEYQKDDSNKFDTLLNELTETKKDLKFAMSLLSRSIPCISINSILHSEVNTVTKEYYKHLTKAAAEENRKELLRTK